VLSWAAVPDRVVPASAPWVADAVGANCAFALGTDAACATSLIQMDYAAAMIETGRIKYALLTQSHLMTRAFPMGHPASPNIGDGATAIVMGPGAERELLGVHAVTEGEHYDAVTWMRGIDEDPPWYEAGAAFFLGSKKREAARFLARNTVGMGAQTIREMMAALDAPLHKLSAVISVQPRRWIPGAIAEVLGLAPDCAPHTFDELAHLGSAGVVTNLIAGRQRGLLQPGKLVALYAQGAGFTRAAALVRW
jgi:3-oxoacyl-[acyl-carrier-protein] synthase-3